MINVIDDLAMLTSIPTQILKKIENDTLLCVAEGMNEALLEGKTVAEFDIGYGNLSIVHENNQLKYKFIPSAKLNDMIVRTVKDMDNPFVQTVNESLVNKLTSLYRDLL